MGGGVDICLWLVTIRATGKFYHSVRERRVVPGVPGGIEEGLEQIRFAGAIEGANDEGGEIAAGILGVGVVVGEAGGFAGEMDSAGGVDAISHGDGCEAHDGAIAGKIAEAR